MTRALVLHKAHVRIRVQEDIGLFLYEAGATCTKVPSGGKGVHRAPGVIWDLVP